MSDSKGKAPQREGDQRVSPDQHDDYDSENEAYIEQQRRLLNPVRQVIPWEVARDNILHGREPRQMGSSSGSRFARAPRAQLAQSLTFFPAHNRVMEAPRPSFDPNAPAFVPLSYCGTQAQAHQESSPAAIANTTGSQTANAQKTPFDMTGMASALYPQLGPQFMFSAPAPPLSPSSGPPPWLALYVAALLSPPRGDNDKIPGTVVVGLPWVVRTAPPNSFISGGRRIRLNPSSDLARHGAALGIPEDYMRWMLGTPDTNIMFVKEHRFATIRMDWGYQ